MGAKVQMASAVQAAPATTAGAGMATIPFNTSQTFPGLGSIDSVRQEVDDAFADMKTAYHREPDDVMRFCSGHSARLSEIRVQIQRIEDYHRQWKNVRVREVEPAIDEIRNQYVIASRLQSTRELDFKMAGGQP